jgi:DNA-binding transcriptional MocR family regulator
VPFPSNIAVATADLNFPSLGHNPTGRVISLERKREIYAVCSKYDVIIVEDEPYWYLQFPSAAAEEAKSRGLPSPPPPSPTSEQHNPTHSSGYPFLDSLTPSFLSIDTDGRVVRLDTFSKTVAPGCRLGWITAQPAIAERFQRINEQTTQQPSGFVQSLISELVLGPSDEQQQQPARSAFSLLRTAQEKAAFRGWDMAGWVRWLEGLRGSYERRMVRMCRILDAGSRLVTSAPVPGDDATMIAVHSTPLYSYTWPRGGMFIWLRAHLESHPLWNARTPNNPNFPVLNGPALSTALMVWLTTKPFLVLVATGSMFSADEKIRQEEGWAYYRVCFAAEAEENIDRAAHRFVQGVHAFWEVEDVKVIERLLKELETQANGNVEELVAAAAGAAAGAGDEEVSKLGWYMGC